MSIEFDENRVGNYSIPNQNRARTGSKMGDWLVKNGLATGPAGANIILIILAILVFGLSLYFFKFGLNLPFQNTPEAIDPALFPGDLEL